MPGAEIPLFSHCGAKEGSSAIRCGALQGVCLQARRRSGLLGLTARLLSLLAVVSKSGSRQRAAEKAARKVQPLAPGSKGEEPEGRLKQAGTEGQLTGHKSC